MKSHAALLLGVLVLLGGCLGGVGNPVTGGVDKSDDGAAESMVNTTTESMVETTTTTELPATTDVERNVTATFFVADGQNVTVTLQVADEAEERQRGLMYRQSLANRTGMVFVYSEEDPRTFWMKNTYVPLDIIFIAANGTVLNVQHARAQPHAPDSEVERYPSDGEAKYVVELPRGFANRTGVGPGTQFVFNGTVPEAGPGTPTQTTASDGGEHKAFTSRMSFLKYLG